MQKSAEAGFFQKSDFNRAVRAEADVAAAVFYPFFGELGKRLLK